MDKPDVGNYVTHNLDDNKAIQLSKRNGMTYDVNVLYCGNILFTIQFRKVFEQLDTVVNNIVQLYKLIK